MGDLIVASLLSRRDDCGFRTSHLPADETICHRVKARQRLFACDQVLDDFCHLCCWILYHAVPQVHPQRLKKRKCRHPRENVERCAKYTKCSQDSKLHVIVAVKCRSTCTSFSARLEDELSRRCSGATDNIPVFLELGSLLACQAPR